MSRAIPAAIKAALDSSCIEGLTYLLQLTLKSGTQYWSERAITYGGHTYIANITGIGNIPWEMGDSGKVEVTLSNVDGTVAGLDRQETFLGGKVYIYELVELSKGTSTGSNSSTTLNDTGKTWVADTYIGFEVEIVDGLGAGQIRAITDNSATQLTVATWTTTPDDTSVYVIRGAHLKWTGWSDELQDITLTEAKLLAHAGVATTKCEVPRRGITTSCPWKFGGMIDWTGIDTDTVNFDGFECEYQRTTSIGFRVNTSEEINAVDDPITFAHTALPDSQEFHIDDEIKIDSEIMRIYDVGTGTLTCLRGIRGTAIAWHGSGAAVSYSNCHYTKAACLRRGMYGNNESDTYQIGQVTYKHNYFGGFPVLTALLTGRYNRATFLGRHILNQVTFGGNESAYGKPLPLVYGRCRIISPPLIIAANEGTASEEDKWVIGLFAVCEGVLACNANNGNQGSLEAYGYERYSGGVGVTGYENIFVNGKRRHDPQPGFGIQTGHGQTIQQPCIFAGVPDFETYDLNFRGTEWVFLRIREKNNSDGQGGIDFAAGDVDGDVEIRYGRLVRNYTGTGINDYTFKATGGDPVWALLDFEASKRGGGGVDYSRFDLQTFLDSSDYCNETVASVVDGTQVKRWTFNGCIDQRKSFQEHEKLFCLSMYAMRPYLDSNGKVAIKMLKAETPDDIPIFSSTSGTIRNILANDDGRSTLVKKRKSLLEIPNEVRVNFAAYENSKWIKTTLVLADREAQTLVGQIVGDGTTKVVSKTLDLPGVTSVDEAARIGTLVLRAGEFAEGGIANNLTVEFDTLYRESSAVELGDIIQVEDALLDPVAEAFFRVVKLEDQAEHLSEGGTVFKRKIVATFHDNDIYDDTAYTCTDVTRMDTWGANNGEAPPVTNFEVIEEGIFDKNGTPHSKLTFNYIEPGAYEGLIDNIGGYSEGASSIHLDGLTPGKLIKIHDVIRIGTHAARYQATADATVDGGGEVTVGIAPVLTDPIEDNLNATVYLRDERDNYHSVVIMRSTTDGHLDPVGDWRFVGEFHKPGQSIYYDISNQVEVFTALSRNLAQGVPSPDTKLADGNFKYPRHQVLVDGVEDDNGPPADWSVEILEGPSGVSRSVRVKATRPAINGRNLLRWVWQLRYTTATPPISWLNVDSHSDPNDIYYDGSAIDHKFIDHGTKLERVTGTGFAGATIGRMILMDVRSSNTPGWTWNHDHCQWGTIKGFYKYVGGVETACEYDDPNVVGIYVEGSGFRLQYTADVNKVRIKVVKGIWDWDTEGYLGGWPTPIEADATSGEWIVFDKRTEFISPPIVLDSDYFEGSNGKLYARVFFENLYSCSDGDIKSPTGVNALKLTYEVPDDLEVIGSANGLRILFAGVAWKYNVGITEAEFRAKLYTTEPLPEYADLRTVAEGGTLVNDDDTELIRTLGADYSGTRFTWPDSTEGTWFFAFRFKNEYGWSVWSDGNIVPERVTDTVKTEDPSLEDAGPPAGWDVMVEPGPGHTVIVTATRPETYGHKIYWYLVQIKDSNDGSWNAINSDPVPEDNDHSYTIGEIFYDGSSTAHIYDQAAGTITTPRTDWADALPGDLILFDVRDTTSFNRQYCQWATIPEGGISGQVISGIHGFRPYAAPDSGEFTWTNIRIQIVARPDTWPGPANGTETGYFGGTYGFPNRGLWYRDYTINGQSGNTSDILFVSDPIAIPADLEASDITARVWFENPYSRSDDDTYSENLAPETPGYCVQLTFANPLVVDCALVAGTGKIFLVTLTGDTELQLINGVCGQPIVIVFVQGGGGGHDVTPGTMIQLGVTVNSMNLSEGAGIRDYSGFIYNGGAAKYDLVSFVDGY